MSIAIYPFRETFAAEVGDVNLAEPLSDTVFEEIRQAFWKYAVLVFPGQNLTPEQHLAFSARFGPVEKERTLDPKATPTRYSGAFADISNLDAHGNIWGETSRQRMYKAGNKLWHTDSSFKRLPALCSLLYSRTIAPIGGHTYFADQRAAYDALPDDMKQKLHGLVAEHCRALHRALAAAQRLYRIQRGRKTPPAAGAAGAGAHVAAKRPQIALPRLARRAHPKHARRGRPRAHRPADRSRHPAAIHPHPPLARE
jgi:alpha-ketoglutarate-dependent 2,4-dichlorophenoxyacetate dioxygenase